MSSRRRIGWKFAAGGDCEEDMEAEEQPDEGED
jgi:hypothetical protein